MTDGESMGIPEIIIVNPKFIFNIGEDVKDKITGFTGIITVRLESMYRANQYGVLSKELKDSKPLDLIYFDEGRLERIMEDKIFIGFDPGKDITGKGQVANTFNNC